MKVTTGQSVKFGLFDFDPGTGDLRKEGMSVKLQAQPAKVLGLLIRRAGELVTRQEIQDEVWGGNIVDFDQGLNFCIRQIRIALNDQADSPVYIETVPRQGYRFIAPVAGMAEPASEEEATPAPAPMGSRLKWVMLSLAALAIVATSLWFMTRQEKRTVEGRRMLAVLPFDNFTGDAGQDPICDGLTEELIATLSRLNPDQLGVIARTSAMRYKTEKKPVDRIGKELDVDYLIEGSVRGGAGRLRITVQLIRVADQSHLWARSFDRGDGDILGVQREVSESVARSLALELLPKRSVEVRTDSSPAREAYLKGKYLLAKQDSGVAGQAVEFFQQAVAADPDYAAAHAGLAEALIRRNLPPREKLASARASLSRALQLDETLAEAHCLSGEIARRYELNWDLAWPEFERAIELEPGRARSHHEYAFYFSDLGRHDEAIARMRQALELDPVSPLAQGDLSWLFLRVRRFDEAIRQALKTIELEPRDIGAHFCLFQAYRLQGKREEAARKAREVMVLAGAPAAEIARLDSGDTEKRLMAYHRWEVRMLLDRQKSGYLDPAVLAMSYADRGEAEQAMQLLLRASREGSGFLSSLRSEPRYDPLRSDPRFVELSNRLFPRQ